MRNWAKYLAAAATVIGLACLIPLQAQDFQRTYAIPAGGQISVGNISGDVQVTGYDGDSIIVSAQITGRDRDKVRVEDTSAGNRVELKARYPEHGNTNASVQFDVKVPRAVSYVFERLASISGKVGVSDVRGQIKAASVSGDVTIRRVSGIVSASSVSGDLLVEIVRAEGGGEMKFSSVSGSVEVKAPSDLAADVEISTLSGSLRTDFPIEVQERRYGPGRSAKGRLGSGANRIKISSVSGRVSLERI